MRGTQDKIETHYSSMSILNWSAGMQRQRRRFPRDALHREISLEAAAATAVPEEEAKDQKSQGSGSQTVEGGQGREKRWQGPGPGGEGGKQNQI